MMEPIKCRDCGMNIENTKENRDKFFGPDPFAEEINGDTTSYWMCEDCRIQSALDI